MRERPRCKYFRRRRCFQEVKDCQNCEYYYEWKEKMRYKYAMGQKTLEEVVRA